MERIKRNVIVIGLMALAIGLGSGLSVAWAGISITNASVSPSLVSPGTPVAVTADIIATQGNLGTDVWIDVWKGLLPDGSRNYILHAGNVKSPATWDQTYHLNYILDTTGYVDGNDYKVDIYAFDLGGWPPAAGVTIGPFTVDSTGPVIANAAVLDNAVPAGTPVIVTADIISDGALGTDVWLDVRKGGNYILHAGNVKSPATWDQTYHLNYILDTTGYVEGTYSIDLIAFDTLSSWGPPMNHINSVTVSFNIDNPPVVTITHPQDGNYAAASLNVSGNAYDTIDGPLPVEVSINPVVLQSDADGDFGGQVVGPSTGNIVISAKAIDSAGNVGSDSVTILRVHDNRK